jgi:phosphoglucomutase
MTASKQKSLSEQIKDFFIKYGRTHGMQKIIPLSVENEKKFKHLMKKPPDHLGPRKVMSVETIDGLKLNLSDEDWILLRLSGTEPLVRCYGEAGSKRELKELMDVGLQILS